MARRKMAPEDQQAHDLESLRVHAFLFCQEAGLPRGTLMAMPTTLLKRSKSRPEGKATQGFAFIDHTGNYEHEFKGTFEACEAWICAARNGVAIVNRHNGLKHGRG